MEPAEDHRAAAVACARLESGVVLAPVPEALSFGMPVSSAPRQRGPEGIQVIARTAEILRILRAAPGGLSQAELGDHIGLARSTVHRLLTALQDEGLVEAVTPRGRYRLGPAITRIAGAAWRGSLGDLHPLLDQLARQADETVNLSVLARGTATIADQVPGAQRLRAVSAVGETLPLHATAAGKALLAAMTTAARQQALPATLARLTPATITARPALDAELGRIRAQGYATDHEEHTDGVCAIAVSLGRLAEVPAAVAVQLPARRFYGREHALAQELMHWADDARARSGAR
jgi:DNA-binding IclR family transcriptional regulator